MSPWYSNTETPTLYLLKKTKLKNNKKFKSNNENAKIF